jgi:outer membrane usher protein
MASRRPFPSNGSRSALFRAIAVSCLGAAVAARADSRDAAYAVLDEPMPGDFATREQRLYLDVFHGDRATGVLAEVWLHGGRVSASAAELQAMGLVLPAGVTNDPDGRIGLDAVPGLAWRYDAPAQRLYLDIPIAMRPRQTLGYIPPAPVQAERPPGWRLGYDAYGRQHDQGDTLALATSLAWFGRLGTLENYGVSQFADAPTGGTGDGYTRLDTHWTYSDPQRMWNWTAGDLINGGLDWTRSVRMAGLQWRRDFATRPDLVTVPVPRFNGDATLPSAVELYVDNVRTFGSDVQDGPFVLDATPALMGAGMARLVVRDALGRETTTTVPLYFDNQRLAPGLSDFSVELGVLRRGYGGGDDDEYGDDIAGSASWRRGMTDTITLEAHAEATRGLQLAGAGIVWSPGNRWGLLTAAVARSDGDRAGWQHSLGYQYISRGWGLDVHSLRRDAGYRDLGDASTAAFLPTSLRAEDRATAWLATAAGDFSTSWIRYEDRLGLRTEVTSLGWNRQFGGRLYVSANVFDDGGRTGGGISVSLPLGPDRHAFASVQDSQFDDPVATLDLRQDIPYEGGWGGGVHVSDRDGGEGRAYAGYRNDHVEASGGIEHAGGSSGAFAQAAGSVVGLGGRVFFSRLVYDAFALVSTGVAGVPVLHENRLYGTTDADGYLLLPQLRGWQRNRVAIDPDALPANYRVDAIERFATPTDRGGVVVAFDVRALAPAIVVLLDRDGDVLPAGMRIDASDGGVAIVGFDGEVYLASLDRATVLQAPVVGGSCRYALAAIAVPADGAPARLGPVACDGSTR